MDKFQYGVASITIIEDGMWQVNYKGWGASQCGMEWQMHNLICSSYEDALKILKIKIEKNKDEYYKRIKDILDEEN